MHYKKTILILISSLLLQCANASNYNIIIEQESNKFDILTDIEVTNTEWSYINDNYDCVEKFSTYEFDLGTTFDQTQTCKRDKERTVNTTRIINNVTLTDSKKERIAVDVVNNYIENGTLDKTPLTRAQLDVMIANNENVSYVNVSEIKDFSFLFSENATFNQDIGNWDTSSVTDMYAMFYRAKSFNRYIGDWNVSNVIKMRSAFNEAILFNQDLNNWNTENVVNMKRVFYRADSFNKDLSNWNLSKTTETDYMFYKAYSFNKDISNWNVSNVTDMSSMFQYANSFNQNLNIWNVDNVLIYDNFDVDSFINDKSNKPNFK